MRKVKHFSQKAAKIAFRGYYITTIIKYHSFNPDEEIPYDMEVILEHVDNYTDFLYKCVPSEYLDEYGKQLSLFILSLPRYSYCKKIHRYWNALEEKYVDKEE
jgi:hypothetical protein